MSGGLAEAVGLNAEGIDLSILSRREKIDVLKIVDVVVGGGLDTASLNSAQCLRAVMSLSAGYDGTDVETASELGILVTNQAGGNALSVAEHGIGLLLS